LTARLKAYITVCIQRLRCASIVADREGAAAARDRDEPPVPARDRPPASARGEPLVPVRVALEPVRLGALGSLGRPLAVVDLEASRESPDARATGAGRAEELLCLEPDRPTVAAP
jgi:hypothetical protein